MRRNYGQTGQGVGPIKLIDASSSTAESKVASFAVPVSKFGLQVVATSTDAIVVLQGSVASSSAASKTTLITFARSSDGSGDTLFTVDKPVSAISATITAGASSGGATAWVSATP